MLFPAYPFINFLNIKKKGGGSLMEINYGTASVAFMNEYPMPTSTKRVGKKKRKKEKEANSVVKKK